MADDPKVAGSVTSVTPSGTQPITAPVFYAGSIQVMQAGPDLTLVLAQPRPLINMAGAADFAGAVNQAVAIIHMSVANAKDLSLMLTDFVKHYEGSLGEIKTEFSLQRSK